MQEKQKPHKHHFVPQAYLRQFLKEGKLFTLDIRKVKQNIKKEIKAVTPGQICYREDYYTLVPKTGNDTFRLNSYHEFFIEQDVFQILENRYTKIVSDIINQNQLSLADAALICDFIIQSKLRNPFWEEKVIEKRKDEWINATMDDFTRQTKENPKFSKLSLDVMQRVIEDKRKSILGNPNLAKEIQQYSLIQRKDPNTNQNSQVRKILLDCDWQVFKAPTDGPFFITTDNPGAAIDPDGIKYNTKFTKGFMFFFPLTPGYCLLITDEGSDDAISQQKPTKLIPENIVPDYVVYQVNDTIINFANNLLIASDTSYLAQISEINKPQNIN